MDNQNILAVVAGEEITQKDLDALIAALPKEQQAYAGNEHFRPVFRTDHYCSSFR